MIFDAVGSERSDNPIGILKAPRVCGDSGG